MKAFIWNEVTYIRCVPAKSLFHSTLVHEVVNRGDVFALRVSDQMLTIVPGTAVVEHIDMGCTVRGKTDTLLVAAMKKELTTADKLRCIDKLASSGSLAEALLKKD